MREQPARRRTPRTQCTSWHPRRSRQSGADPYHFGMLRLTLRCRHGARHGAWHDLAPRASVDHRRRRHPDGRAAAGGSVGGDQPDQSRSRDRRHAAERRAGTAARQQPRLHVVRRRPDVEGARRAQSRRPRAGRRRRRRSARRHGVSQLHRLRRHSRRAARSARGAASSSRSSRDGLAWTAPVAVVDHINTAIPVRRQAVGRRRSRRGLAASRQRLRRVDALRRVRQRESRASQPHHGVAFARRRPHVLGAASRSPTTPATRKTATTPSKASCPSVGRTATSTSRGPGRRASCSTSRPTAAGRSARTW